MFDFALKPLPVWYSEMVKRTILVVIGEDHLGFFFVLLFLFLFLFYIAFGIN